MSLGRALREQEEKLLHCVHCGFCLPACPTYTRLGDEADSPRGRLYLMRAVAEGRLDPGEEAFQLHIDRCLGCRACEPVCPSGVEYGALLERARQEAVEARAPGVLTRALLGVLGSARLRKPFLALSRLLRSSGLPALAARTLPSWGVPGRLRMAAGMLAASGGGPQPWSTGGRGGSPGGTEGGGREGEAGTVAMLTGCIQEGLFRRVNRATVRVLEVNGYRVVPAPGQECCGALHAHGGRLDEARRLARRNLAAFESAKVEGVVVNAAGCGAAMKEYGDLLAEDPELAARARRLSGRVRDISQLLVGEGLPRTGGKLPMRVAYDAPCHLLHAQRVEDPPLEILASIPGLELVPLEGSEECCGGAGIYGITHPGLGGRIGRDKVEAIRASGAAVVATGNPGCIMQIGSLLRMEGLDVEVLHPVELLDESYRRAGFYGER